MYGTQEPTIPFAERTRTRMVAGMREAEARQREAIVAALAQADRPATLADLGYALDLNPGLVRTRVQELVEEGAIEPLGDAVELGARLRAMNARRLADG